MRLTRIVRKLSPVLRMASLGPEPALETICQRTWEPLPEGSEAEPMVDPPMTPRDEAVAMLHAAAEVEHALMVQYLYAGYSMKPVEPGDPRAGKVALIRHLLLHIAREEMAHLASVQNLLRLLGAPLHLDREHSAFASSLLPFRFKLEPVSLGSLAKYVIAESPRPLREGVALSADDILDIHGELTTRAKASNDGVCPGHVGDIFARLIWLFRNGLADGDFRPDTDRFQAAWEDWGFDPKTRKFDGVDVGGEPSLVRQFAGSDPVALRAAAVAALQAIADQGEGEDQQADGKESHFEWFWLLYRTFRELTQMPGGAPVHSVPVNPNTTAAPGVPAPYHKMVDSGIESANEAGRITNPRSRRWAQLFNVRYRLLLAQFHHFLRIDTALYDASGDRLARGYLLLGVFQEMRRLKSIAGKLVQLPRGAAADPHRAGPPFELPYTTAIPDGESNRWAMHGEVSRGAARLLDEILEDPLDAEDGFLADVKSADEADRAVMAELAAGRALPPQPPEFPKVVRILEEAVRGFAIREGHGNFWAGKTLAEFQTGFGAGPRLTAALRGTLPGTPRMPLERPPVPEARIRFIETWMNAGAADSNPPFAGLKREREPAAEPDGPAPQPGPPSFATAIRPLFRPADVSCMKAMADFDLSVYEDVKANAVAIHGRLESGSMPPSGRWPQPDIDRFKAWVDAGFPA